MRNIILIIISAFVFTACSSKEEINTNNTINQKQIELKVQTTSLEEEDEFDGEFDEEFTEEVKEVFDPLSGYNRVMTKFNDIVYINVLDPVARGYAYVVPKGARAGISNFTDNLMFPVRFSNNLLQLKFKNASEELGRFVVNTIFGLGGFVDTAKTELGWVKHDEDFGQTLGFYGVGEGFHVVLPLLGPSNLRDMVGLTADSYVSALSTTGSSDIKYKIPNNTLENVGIMAGQTINATSLNLGLYQSLKKDAYDLYPFLRDLYNQRRNSLIKE